MAGAFSPMNLIRTAIALGFGAGGSFIAGDESWAEMRYEEALEKPWGGMLRALDGTAFGNFLKEQWTWVSGTAISILAAPGGFMKILAVIGALYGGYQSNVLSAFQRSFEVASANNTSPSSAPIQKATYTTEQLAAMGATISGSNAFQGAATISGGGNDNQASGGLGQDTLGVPLKTPLNGVPGASALASLTEIAADPMTAKSLKPEEKQTEKLTASVRDIDVAKVRVDIRNAANPSNVAQVAGDQNLIFSPDGNPIDADADPSFDLAALDLEGSE